MTRLALVTRPKADAARVSEALTELGFKVMVEPMLAIEFRRAVTLPLWGVQAYLATSANGVRALAATRATKSLPLYAVGEATAAVARDLGFDKVAAAGGDVASLVDLVKQSLKPEVGSLVHVSGVQVAGDLIEPLAEKGYRVRREILYEAQAADAFTPALVEALEAKRIDCALFFSPRSGKTFASLARDASLDDCLKSVTAYALSRGVADSLAGVPWKGLYYPEHPSLDALIQLIHLSSEETGKMGDSTTRRDGFPRGEG